MKLPGFLLQGQDLRDVTKVAVLEFFPSLQVPVQVLEMQWQKPTLVPAPSCQLGKCLLAESMSRTPCYNF